MPVSAYATGVTANDGTLTYAGDSLAKAFFYEFLRVEF